eukprot:6109632-Prymnesium_polylepis.1
MGNRHPTRRRCQRLRTFQPSRTTDGLLGHELFGRPAIPTFLSLAAPGVACPPLQDIGHR